MRPGESFEFHTLVLDAAGCGLALSPVWKVVSDHPALELSGPGKIRVPEDAPESTVELQATLAGHSARVVVEVASQQRYDALLAQKGLNAEGESSDASVAGRASSHPRRRRATSSCPSCVRSPTSATPRRRSVGRRRSRYG